MNRKDFYLSNKIYFDNAATTLKPKQVISKINEYYKKYCSNIHRGVYEWSIKASEEYETARETIANFINAKPNEIIFTRNTTEGINLIANSFKFKSKNIISTIFEHHSNFLPWQELKNKGFKINYINLNDNYEISLNDLENKITKNSFVAIHHVSNVLGVKNNIKEIYKLIKDYNSYLLVDAAQSAPHTKINAKYADFIAFSAHKMLGPTGVGALYINENNFELLKPYQVGGGTIKDVGIDKTEYAEIPSKYEAGTPNIAGVIGFKEAINYINKIGIENIEKHEQNLVKYLLKELNNFNEIEIIGNTRKNKLGVVALKTKNVKDLGFYLSINNIFTRYGHHCAIPLHKYFKTDATLRISLYLYNTKKEIKTLIEKLNDYFK